MAEPLAWCVSALRGSAGPRLRRALSALRSRHSRGPGGAARIRERGGVGALVALLRGPGPGPVLGAELELALSVLGNLCTERGCRRQARDMGAHRELVSLLSLPGPECVLSRVVRTLANLALEPEGARDILEAGAAPLLVSLCLSCGSASCLHGAARALRILGSAPCHRRSLASCGAVAALASRLAALPASHPAAPSLARALRALTQPPCAALPDLLPALPALAALAAQPKAELRCPALGAIANACALGTLRPALGAAGAVEPVLEELRRSRELPDGAGALRALCLLCREAVNRVRIRAGGGLELLLRGLERPQGEASRGRILLALAAFAYDQEALEALEALGAVPVLVELLQGMEEPGDGEDEDDEDDEEEEEAAASCDQPRDVTEQNRAATGSFRGLRSWLLSESLSPPPSPPPPPSCSPPPHYPPLPPLALPQGAGPWRWGRGRRGPILLLLSRLGLRAEPSPALLEPAVLGGLLRALGGGARGGAATPLSPVLARLLQRVLGHAPFLGALVRGFVPSLLRSRLVLGGEGRARRELGEALLRTVAAVAAAPFGVGLLTHMMRCGSAPARLACATALPLIAGPSSPAHELLWGGGGVALLLSAVAQGPGSPYEPPPGFLLYAADAIALLRAHAKDTLQHAMDTAMDPMDTAMDPMDTPEHDKDTAEHAKDTAMHPVNTPGHAKDTLGHTKDTAMDPRDTAAEDALEQGSKDEVSAGPSPMEPWGFGSRLPPLLSPLPHGGAGGAQSPSGDGGGSSAPPVPAHPFPTSPIPSPLGPNASPSLFPSSIPSPASSNASPLGASPSPLGPSGSPLGSNAFPTPFPTSSPSPLSSNASPTSSSASPLGSNASLASPLAPNGSALAPSASPLAPDGSALPPSASPLPPNRSLLPPAASPLAPPQPPLRRPAAPCPYSLSPHDLAVLPSGRPPRSRPLPASRSALSASSPVLGAMLGGRFSEGRRAWVSLGCAPAAPLLLLLHFLHGCRRRSCPLWASPLAPGVAGAALALARRFLLREQRPLEAAVAAGVRAAPGALWALAERWGSAALARRAARALLQGAPQRVARRLGAAAARARSPRLLAQALMGAIDPRRGGGGEEGLEMGAGWGGDPLVLRGAGEGDGDLEEGFGPYKGMEGPCV
ncbi:armadillo repeat-containing protein 5 [Pezoporus occidentalis]|uniref:armadillo repeat-containing protein 5 n=1 Tax=Pezoporus occidentalis TaxID=407982 RepID=UPI002F916B4C